MYGWSIPGNDDAVAAPPSIRWAVALFLVALGAASYLHWPALTDPLVYKSDVRQSPHWSAYHTDTFRDDDLLLTLAAHNESPLMNLIYYVGTFAVDMVTLGKWLAVLGYGLAAVLFYWLVGLSHGHLSGSLAAFAFTFLPDQFEYFAGGFSKAWMIPILLIGVVLLERENWRGLALLMPFGAVAYPVSAVLLGAVVLCWVLLEVPARGRRVVPAFTHLCLGSALALAVLSIKYVFPPAGIGPLTPGRELRSMPEMYAGGMYHYLPLPSLLDELSRHLVHPFVLVSVCVFLACLSRSAVAWSRALTALVLASVVFYLLADALFMNLYQPNRYTRYSIAVVLAIWYGRNWSRVLELIPWRLARYVALAGLLGLGGYQHRGTFRKGKDTSPRQEWAALNRFVATLPPKVLIAGSPKYMDDIPIQARRSVLCNYKLAHPWYSEYYAEIRRRTEATFDALYAQDSAPVNRLHEVWGVTHLVVVKRYLSPTRVHARDTYVEPYDTYIAMIAGGRRSFLFNRPPRDRVLYEDEELFVVELPLDVEPTLGEPGS